MAMLTLAGARTAVLSLLRQAAADTRRPRTGGRLVIAIDGRSGAGKTTLAGLVAAAVQWPVLTLSMDSLYPGWDGLEAGAERLVADVLRPLAAGGPVQVRPWDWRRSVEGPYQPLQIPRAGLLIIEGAGAASQAAVPYLSAIIWVDGDEEVRRARALARDGDVFAPHWQRWGAQESAYASRESVAGRSDLVIEALLPDTGRATAPGMPGPGSTAPDDLPGSA